MDAGVVAREGDRLTLQVTVDISGSMLQAEEKILDACNALGCVATEMALKRFDTDGSPIVMGAIKWTAKRHDDKEYQTPYGPVVIPRYMYQTSRGGKTCCPLESAARIIRGATPRFAKILTHKYACLNAPSVCRDLAENHRRTIAHSYLQNVAGAVGSIATAKEESWHYAMPKLDAAIDTVTVSLDGAMLLMREDGWREAMVGSLSLYDTEGERRHSIYIGAPPEYGKAAFFKRFEHEIAHVKLLYPDALYLGVADGTKNNWSFLEQHTTARILDFYHATEYLARVAYAAHPEKTGKPARQRWHKASCHKLKHNEGAAGDLLEEMRTLSRRRKLPEATREDLDAAITYFDNQQPLMNYAANVAAGLPIGSGVTEAACKTLIKQRFCGSGMRWKEKGLKTVLSLRALVQTDARWDQFWKKIDQYGSHVAI
jgi:hypothetical protein